MEACTLQCEGTSGNELDEGDEWAPTLGFPYCVTEPGIPYGTRALGERSHRSIAPMITMGYVSLIWYTTPMNQKNVGDFVRAGCGDKSHVRFGRLRHEVASVAVGTESSGPNPMFCHRYPTKTCAWSNSRVGSFWDKVASPERVVINP